MFVPLAREGWLQKLVASAAHPFGRWTVVWAELLEDGKLSWFDSARKRKADFRHASLNLMAPLLQVFLTENGWGLCIDVYGKNLCIDGVW